MKRAQIERRLEVLGEFRVAYTAAFELRSRSAESQQTNEALARVELLAAKAARSFDAAGIAVDYSRPGTHTAQAVNPAMLWQVALEPGSWFPPSMLDQLTLRAIGRLEDLRDDPPTERRGVFIPVPSWSSLSGPGKWLAGVVSGLVVSVGGASILRLLGWL